MPRLIHRQDRVRPTAAELASVDDLTRTWCDAVLVDGADPTAAHRARIRALNAAAQQEERQKDQAARQHAVDVRAAEAERGHRRPRGASWPATLRAVRTGKAD